MIINFSNKFLSYAANFPEHVVESLPSELESGVYFGWACVDQGPIYKMVMSIGWNPQFQNEKRSMVSANLYFTYTYSEEVQNDTVQW